MSKLTWWGNKFITYGHLLINGEIKFPGYQLLQRVSHKPSQKDYKTIEQIGASSKNRYPNKIPCEYLSITIQCLYESNPF